MPKAPEQLRMSSESVEILLGFSAIILFAIALVVWPKLGYFIGDVVDAFRGFVLGAAH
jgi:phosphotransferase system  glucose/maltose/N-acetylglucosamine-specific IIC component